MKRYETKVVLFVILVMLSGCEQFDCTQVFRCEHLYESDSNTRNKCVWRLQECCISDIALTNCSLSDALCEISKKGQQSVTIIIRGDVDFDPPLITLSTNRINFLEALDEICLQGHCVWGFSNNILIIKPQNDPDVKKKE